MKLPYKWVSLGIFVTPKHVELFGPEIVVMFACCILCQTALSRCLAGQVA